MYEEGYFNYILGENYAAANTPLPYLPAYLISKLTNTQPSLPLARICNFIFSLIAVWLFIKLYRKLNNNEGDYGVLIFVFYPYFLKTSFTFYMALYGVLFLLWAVYLFQSKVKWNTHYSGLASSAGILSQQFIIALPVGLVIGQLCKTKDLKGETGDVKGETRFKEHAVFFIPLIIPAVLFMLWGGFTHPNWRSHNVTVDLTHLTAVFTITGAVFFPYIIQKIKWERFLIAVGIIAILLTIFFTPGLAAKGNYELVTGYTYNFLYKIKEISSLLFTLLQFILCFSGIFAFYSLFKERNNYLENILFFSAVMFVLIFFLNTVFSERHLLPMMACLFLLVIPRIKLLWLKRAWIAYQVIFGCVYFYYWMFVNANF